MFYSPISKGRLKSIRSGNIDLYDAFKKSEDGFIYQSMIFQNDNLDIVLSLFCENLNDECLPISGETIDSLCDSAPLSETKINL